MTAKRLPPAAPVASEDRATPLDVPSSEPVAASDTAGRLTREQNESNLDRLDEALESLDARLSDRTQASGRPPRLSAPSDQSHATTVTPRAPTPPVEPEPPSIAAGEEKPVFEIDEDWFEPRDAAPIWQPARSGLTDPEASSASRAEEQEQGAPRPTIQTTYELSDEAIDRIAARVADRLTRGPLVENVDRLTSEMFQRLVREEIARLISAPGPKNE